MQSQTRKLRCNSVMNEPEFSFVEVIFKLSQSTLQLCKSRFGKLFWHFRALRLRLLPVHVEKLSFNSPCESLANFPCHLGSCGSSAALPASTRPHTWTTLCKKGGDYLQRRERHISGCQSASLTHTQTLAGVRWVQETLRSLVCSFICVNVAHIWLQLQYDCNFSFFTNSDQIGPFLIILKTARDKAVEFTPWWIKGPLARRNTS